LVRGALLLLALVAVALAIQAPAWLLGRSVQERSGGLVELRQASGSLWNGEAEALVRGRDASEREISLGRLAWRVDRVDWRLRALVFNIRQTAGGARAATLVLGADRIGMAGSVRLPAALAGRLAPLKGWTIAGEVIIDSDALEWAKGAGTGAVAVLWRNARLTPPDLSGGFALGEVTAQVVLDGATIVASARNSGGELELTGEASSRTGTLALLLQPRTGAAGASAKQIAWLQAHTMGRTPQGFTIAMGWPGR
jgi:general secretion pathway protein N